MCSHCRQSQRRRFVSLSTTRSISISITLRYREFRLCSIDSPLNFFPSIFGRPMFTLSARCTTIFALRLTLFHFFFSLLTFRIRASIYLPRVANDIEMPVRNRKKQKLRRTLSFQSERPFFASIFFSSLLFTLKK